MDAKRNMAKEPQPREGEATQMEGLGLEGVVERARGNDTDALGRFIADLPGAYSDCVVTC